jgi:hypothetical protein
MKHDIYLKKYSVNLRICILLIFVLSTVGNSQAQKNEAKSFQALEAPAPLHFFSPADSVKWANIPVLKLPAHYKHQKNLLPYMHDNSTQPYFRPLFNDVAYECGQASGVAMGFTYEIDFIRNVPANVMINQYPTHFVYNFHNDGQTYEGASFFDSWEIIQQLGTPNVTDYGGSLSYGGVKRWMTGYNLYYNAMHNRLYDFYMIRTNTPEGILTMKQWMMDHCDGSTVGGIANMYTTYISTASLNVLPAGTEEAGKYVVTQWSNVNHGLTICGWNDSIRYDYNSDGQYTNDIDITGDGIVDVRDWEIGGVKFANTYANPGGNTWGNSGFAYAMYRSLAMPVTNGGIWNNAVYVLKAKESCEPRITFKISLKHNSRNNLKISAGVSSDTTATVPENIMEFTMFNYHGGNFYMQGGTTEADKTLEFGLDVTPLLNYIHSGQPAKYFLLVNEKDPSNDGTGQLVSFSMMDYTGTAPAEIAYPFTNVQLTENGLTVAGITGTINFSDLEIITDTLPAALAYENYIYQLAAAGGTEPYHWDFDWQYTQTASSETFPMVSAEQIFTNNSDNGWAVHNLDFTFPYYGKNYNQIIIHDDGMILFSVQDFEWIYPNSQDLLFKAHEVIAPYYCDLRYYSASADKIWFQGDQNSATIRWDASIDGYQGTSNVNVALKIYPSGKIEFYYGTIILPSNIDWVSGIARGDVITYQKSSISNTFGFPPNTKIIFEPPVYPPELQISEDGLLSGTPLQEYYPTDIKFKVIDNNSLVATKVLQFSTSGIMTITVTGYNVESGNDSIVEFGETALLGIDLTNNGDTAAANGTVVISTMNPYITITDSTENFSFIDTGQTISLDNAFSFEVAYNIPNEHSIDIIAAITSTLGTTTNHVFVTGYAPVLDVINVIVDDDSNGILEQGETSDVQVVVNNSGGASLDYLYSTISSSDPYISINAGNYSLGLIPADSNDTLLFNVTSDSITPAGHMVTFNLEGSGNNNFTYNDHFSIITGHYDENFETGDFSLFQWNFAGNAGWTIDSVSPYEGGYCARSGVITHSQQSSLFIVLDVINSGTISFYRKVSCEDDPNNDNYDYLAFYLDGNEMDRWDGLEDWALFTFAVDTGTHTLKWSYVKDYSVSEGSDAAWIDYISFPPVYFITPLSINMVPGDTVICEGDSVILTAYPNGGSGSYAFSWSPSYGLSDINTANPVASPDVSTTYYVTLTDGTVNLSSEVTVTVNPAPPVPVISLVTNALVSDAIAGNQWYNDDGIIPGATGQVYYPPHPGNYYVIVTNPAGCSSGSSNVIYFHYYIDEIGNEMHLTVKPNPFTDEIIIIYSNPDPGLVYFEIDDFTGKMVRILSPELPVQYKMNDLIWNGTDNNGHKLPQGVYFLKFFDGQKFLAYKIIKL